ncbi:MAG: hypothetical protein FH753_00175 [Firmicutes bacterium]|nr:hypothetical protein [Bacillota bacterium]
MKKVSGLLILVILMISLSSCTSTVETKKKEEKLYTISGKEFVCNENTFLDYEIGFGIMYPKFFNNLRNNSKIGATVLGSEGVIFEYRTKAIEEFFTSLDNLSDEEMKKKYKELDKYEIEIFGVFKEVADKNFKVEDYNSDFNNIEYIGQVDGYKYYFAYNYNFKDNILTKEEREDVNKIIDRLDNIKNNICIFGKNNKEGYCL